MVPSLSGTPHVAGLDQISHQGPRVRRGPTESVAPPERSPQSGTFGMPCTARRVPQARSVNVREQPHDGVSPGVLASRPVNRRFERSASQNRTHSARLRFQPTGKPKASDIDGAAAARFSGDAERTREYNPDSE